MCVKDRFSSCSWLPVIFGWIYQMCLFRDFCSRPWIREAPFKILVLSLSWHSANGGCENKQPLGRLCLWRIVVGMEAPWNMGLTSQVADTMCVCSWDAAHQTRNMTRHRKVAVSCWQLFVTENFQPGRPWMERMAGQCSWNRLCGFHHAPQEVVPLGRCYSTFSATGHRCLKAVTWLCIMYQDEQLSWCSRSARSGRRSDLHRP